MAIDTKLNIDTSIKSRSDTITPNVRQDGGQMDRFMSLADALQDFNPALKEFVIDKTKEKGKEQALEGANAINGMTIEEAREAHKAGFPDIENAWARYGAYKQYAVNSANKFLYDAQLTYNSNKGDKNYDWEADYTTAYNTYIEGKDGDAYFMSALNEANQGFREWVNTQEVERQSKFLTEDVKKNTGFTLNTLPQKVMTRLEVDWLANYTGVYDFDDTGYAEEKQKFITENFREYWFEELDNIKKNLNPAITLSDLDDQILRSANRHLEIYGGGTIADLYAEMIFQARPDGTPAIQDNPKFEKAALEWRTKYLAAKKVATFENDFKYGSVLNYTDTDYKKLSNDMFAQKVAFYRSQGASDGAATMAAFQELMPFLGKNKPIKAIQDLLNRPIGLTPTGIATEDSKAALSIAVLLSQNGMLGGYFTENNKKNALLWSIAVRKINAGEQPESVLNELGRYSASYNFRPLITADKESLQNTFSDVDYTNAKNNVIINDIATWYKSISPSDEWESNANQFIKDNYVVYNGDLYSKNKMQMMGIPVENMELAKEVIVEVLNKKLIANADNIEYNDLDLFKEEIEFNDQEENIVKISAPNGDAFKSLAEVVKIIPANMTGAEIKKRYNIDFKLNSKSMVIAKNPKPSEEIVKDNIKDQNRLRDFEVLIMDNGEIGLSLKAGVETYQLPSTYTTKDGKVFFLTISLEELHKGLEAKQKVVDINAKGELLKKDKKKQKKVKKAKEENKQTEEMLDLSGYGEIK